MLKMLQCTGSRLQSWSRVRSVAPGVWVVYRTCSWVTIDVDVMDFFTAGASPASASPRVASLETVESSNEVISLVAAGSTVSLWESPRCPPPSPPAEDVCFGLARTDTTWFCCTSTLVCVAGVPRAEVRVCRWCAQRTA